MKKLFLMAIAIMAGCDYFTDIEGRPCTEPADCSAHDVCDGETKTCRRQDDDNDGVCDLWYKSESCPIGEGFDNCVGMPNPDQIDSDEDGIGDACDDCALDPQNDADQDRLCSNDDACPERKPAIAQGDLVDHDGDRVADGEDETPCRLAPM